MTKHLLTLLALSCLVLIQACGPKMKSNLQPEHAMQNEITQAGAHLEPLPQNSNSVSFTLPQLDLGQAPTLHLMKVHILVIPNNLVLKPVDSGTLIQSTDNSLEITVDSIAIDETIQKDFNGLVANIRAYARCNNVIAQIHDSNSMLGGLMVKNIKSAGNWKLENPIIQVSSPEFQMATEACTGARGFAQLIESTIRKDLQDHQTMSQLINEYLIPMMTKWGGSGSSLEHL